MKNVIALLLITLIPVLAHAADRYSYQCEDDENGQEGLCIAVPNDQAANVKNKQAARIQERGLPPKDRSKMLANEPQPKTTFNAADTVTSETLAKQAGNAKAGTADAATKNITAQEKIRQVEIFLQPTRGAQGIGTDSGPSKAGH